MRKHLLILIVLLLIEKPILTYAFLLSNHLKLILIPSVAFRYDPTTTNSTQPIYKSSDWVLYIQGWVFRENPVRELVAKTALAVTIDEIDSDRVVYFTASGKGHKYVCINGLKHEVCLETDQDGLIETQFQVSNDRIEQFRIPNGKGYKVEYTTSTFNHVYPDIGEIVLCDHDGIAIISDIDDTIKVTGVSKIGSVLQNTFSGDYKAVPAMAQRYRHYESLYNATFHYLTASPDQLYPFLREFFVRENFPLGSFHMRHFTWFDTNFARFFSSKSFIGQKTNILHMFFSKTRSKKFILFGDIFQKDPEIYASIYQTFPDRIIKIFIRISEETTTHRLYKVFNHIPKSKWATFINGTDLPETIF